MSEVACPIDERELIESAVADNLSHWGLSPDVEVNLLNHSENATFLIRDGGSKSVLRVHRLGYHTREGIAAELDWIKSISEETPIRAALPIAGVNGEFIQTFSTAADERFAVLFEFLEGEEPSEEQDLVQSFSQLGRITAILHGHSKGWAPSSKVPRLVWDYEHAFGANAIWGDWRAGFGMTPEIVAQFESALAKIRQKLDDYGRDSEHFGLIHSDLRLANLLIHQGSVRVIDFDDCGHGWFMYDLASALSFIEHKDYVPDLVRAWIEGYGAVRPLTAAELSILPTMILFRRILLVAWMGSHNETNEAKALGEEFTHQTCDLISRYLDGHLFGS